MKFDFTPDPKVLIALTHTPMQPLDALCELIDNAIDSFLQMSIIECSQTTLIGILLKTFKEDPSRQSRLTVLCLSINGMTLLYTNYEMHGKNSLLREQLSFAAQLNTQL